MTHPRGPTVTVERSGLLGLPQVAVDQETGKRVVAVIANIVKKGGGQPVIPRSDEVEKLKQMLDKFIRGDDRSVRFASQLGDYMHDLFPDDESLYDVVFALASYQPGGGQYLYNDSQMVALCKWALEEIRKREAQS